MQILSHRSRAETGTRISGEHPAATSIPHWLPFALCMYASIICYLKYVTVPFFTDDLGQIYFSATTYQKGLLATLQAVTPDRPLVSFSLWLNYLMGATNPWIFRLANILILGLTGTSLYYLLDLMTTATKQRGKQRLNLALAILFVVHPLANQTIYMTVQRGVTLAAFFSILTIYFFHKHLQTGVRTFLNLSYFTFILALSSKGNSICVPFILLLSGIYFYKERLLEILIKILPHLLGLGIVFVLYALLKLNPQSGAPAWTHYALVQLRVVFIYFRLFFLPAGLTDIYDVSTEPGLWGNFTWVALLGHLSILLAAFLMRNKARLASFSILAMYMALLPESGLFPIEKPLWAYRAYFPLAFVLLAFNGLTKSPLLEKGVFRFLLVLIPVFTFLTISHMNQIDTPGKWVKYTLSKALSDHAFNTRVLKDYIFSGDITYGYDLASRVSERYPERPDYSVLLHAYQVLSKNNGHIGEQERQSLQEHLKQFDANQVSQETLAAVHYITHRN